MKPCFRRAAFGRAGRRKLARYIIHGMLHLIGHDDRRPNARQRMKKEEGRLLKELGRRFCLSKLRRKTTLAS